MKRASFAGSPRVVAISLRADEKDPLCAGNAPRSAWTQNPRPRRPACAPIGRLVRGPRAELGISSAMLHTSLSMKKSSPVNCRSFNAPPRIEEEGIAAPAHEEAVAAGPP